MSPLSRIKRWGALAAETFGSLLLVLVLFGLFLLFLYALFPSGTPLKELMESGLEAPQGGPVGHQVEATLSSLLREVRLRRGNSIAWGGAREGMQLYSEDAVQTFDKSGADIAFGVKDRLSVGSNSLVVVTRLAQSEEEGPRSYRVQVDGELRGSLSAARKVSMELAAAGHLARIAPGAARFRIAPTGTNSAGFAMYAGEAKVQGKGGTIRVPANWGVRLKKGVAVGAAVPLPPAPVPGGPDKALYRYRMLPPKVRFTWSGAAPDYHFQLSKDQHFKEVVVDEKVGAGEFVTGKLDKGEYYWRVSGVEGGLEGVFSRPGRCQLQQVLKSPELKVSFPPESVAAGPYLLSGTTAPGARVFVDGKEVVTPTPGAFQCEVRLKPGVNLVRVEALDVTGNASYASQIVYGRSGQHEEAVPDAR